MHSERLNPRADFGPYALKAAKEVKFFQRILRENSPLGGVIALKSDDRPGQSRERGTQRKPAILVPIQRTDFPISG